MREQPDIDDTPARDDNVPVLVNVGQSPERRAGRQAADRN